jgi:hypothetical protein
MKVSLFFLLLLCYLNTIAQQTKTITEETPLVDQGMEYGYSIKNVSTKEVSDKEFSRYEVTLYATNKGDCSRVVLYGQSLAASELNMNVLANFDCINATGQRLTSKSGTVTAKPMYVNARVNTKDAQGKSIMENQKVQIGYYIGVSETVENTVIFLVPLNSKPEIKVRVVNRVSVL